MKMKITKSRLMQIIKEELEKVIEEDTLEESESLEEEEIKEEEE